MSAGIEVRTPNGNLIINENYKNVVFDRKIKLSELPQSDSYSSLGPRNTTPYILYKTYTFKPKEDDLFYAITVHPLLAPQISNSEGNPFPMDAFIINSSDSITIQLYQGVDFNLNSPLFEKPNYCRGDQCLYPPKLPEDLYIYVFKEKPIKEGTYCGLQVFSEKGEIVYDSNEKYMKVLYFAEKDGAPSQLPMNTAIVLPPIKGSSPGGGSWGQLLVRNNWMRLKVNWAEGLTAIGVYNAILPIMLLDVTGL